MGKKHNGGWIQKASRYFFESQWFRVRQDEVTLPNGEDITYTLIEHGGYAVIVPLLVDGCVVMERVYPYTVLETLLECPSGGLDWDAPVDAARRELLEETGYAAENFECLGSFYGSDGISNERCHISLATELTATGKLQREATEQMEIELIFFADLHQMARAGKIEYAPTTLATLLAGNRLRRP